MYGGKHSLDAMSRTCRARGAVAQAFFFHILYFRQTASTARRLHSLVETLKTRPDLGLSVHKMYLNSHPFFGPDAESSDRYHLLMNLDEEDQYLKVIKVRQGALLASLLHLTPNLGHAYLSLPESSWNHLSQKVRVGHSKPLHLARLKSLFINHADHGSNGSSNFQRPFQVDGWAAPFLRAVAPNLQVLRFTLSAEVKTTFALHLGRKGPERYIISF